MEEGAKSIELQDPDTEVKPKFTIDQLPELVWRLYGLKTTEYKELPSYDDLNFYFVPTEELQNDNINRVNQDGYVLKILNSLQSSNPVILTAQHAMMKHALDRGVATQEVVPNKEGKDFTLETFTDKNGDKFGPYAVRIVTFVPGTIFHQTPYIAKSFHNIGNFVGKFHKAIEDFDHSFYDTYTTIWSLVEVPVLRDFLHAVKNDTDRQVVEEIITDFEKKVKPQFEHFKKGIIHGDINEQNLIMMPVKKGSEEHDVAAILDFADATKSYPIMDIAISIAYLSIECPDDTKLDVGGHFLSGYLMHRTLNESEMDCLKTLVCSRLCQSLVFGAHSYAQQPWNDYLLTTAKQGWPTMHKLWKADKTELYKRWDTIVKSYTSARTKAN